MYTNLIEIFISMFNKEICIWIYKNLESFAGQNCFHFEMYSVFAISNSDQIINQFDHIDHSSSKFRYSINYFLSKHMF